MNFKKINYKELNEQFYKLNTNGAGFKVCDLENNILELDFTGIPRNEDSLYNGVDFSTYLTFDPFIIEAVAMITDRRVMFTYDDYKEHFGSTASLTVFQLSELMVLKKMKTNDKTNVVGLCNNEEDVEPRFILMHKDFVHSIYDKLFEAIEITKQRITDEQKFSIKYNAETDDVEMSDEFMKALENGDIDENQLNAIKKMIEEAKMEYENEKKKKRQIN